MADEEDVVFRLIAGVHHALGHAQDQADGGAVVLECLEEEVIVGGDDDLLVGGAAGDAAHHVIGGALVRLQHVVQNQRRLVMTGGNGLLDLLGLVDADADGGHPVHVGVGLNGHHVVGILGVVRQGVGHKGRRAMEPCLVGEVVDPAFLPVHGHQGDLALHILALVVLGKAGAAVHDLRREALRLRAVGGIGSGHDVDVRPGDGQGGVIELPAVHGDGDLLHIRQADGGHLPGQEIRRGVLRVAAGGAPAQLVGEVVLIVGQGLRQLLDVALVHLGEVVLNVLTHGERGVLTAAGATAAAAAGSQGEQHHKG